MLTYNGGPASDGGYVKPHLSPHLNGMIPLGGNVGMLDGHVEWRNLTNMLPRAATVLGAFLLLVSGRFPALAPYCTTIL